MFRISELFPPPRPRSCSYLACLPALLLGVSLTSQSQLRGQVAKDAPVVGSDTVTTQSSAGISGTVRDTQGTAISGAQVTLAGQSNGINKATTSDSNGAFSFSDLIAGTYKVTISAPGFETSVASDMVLGAGEKHEMPVTAMAIPTTTTTVHVVATLDEVAEAQVQEQEKQRILGFLPNFYSSYIWDAAPMPSKLKYKLALKSIIDPFAFVGAAGTAGVEMAHKTFPGYGQEMEGYAKRFGSAYADAAVYRVMGSAVFPALLHQDPRYFYRGSGSVRTRIVYAVLASVICRGDDGQLEPNYSRILGAFTSAGISNIYRAPSDRSAGMTFRNGLIITGAGAATNLLREFLGRKLTPNVPAHSIGKP